MKDSFEKMSCLTSKQEKIETARFKIFRLLTILDFIISDFPLKLSD
jgi:hypothetical protein